MRGVDPTMEATMSSLTNDFAPHDDLPMGVFIFVLALVVLLVALTATLGGPVPMEALAID